MRVKGVRIVASRQQIAIAISKHTGKSLNDSLALTDQILSGVAVEFDDDWALEQDLKDLGVRF